LIKTVADSLWLVADGKLRVFDGDLDDYQQWMRLRARADAADADGAATTGAKKGAPKAAVSKGAPKDASNARSLSRLRREIAEIEKRIAEIAAQRAKVEEDLCNQPLNQELQTRYADLNRDAAALESRWMEVGAALEAAETPAGEAG
jgi:ATP-binding cassette subfamily F protein 3